MKLPDEEAATPLRADGIVAGVDSDAVKQNVALLEVALRERLSGIADLPAASFARLLPSK